jgi:hypothetical protein
VTVMIVMITPLITAITPVARRAMWSAMLSINDAARQAQQRSNHAAGCDSNKCIHGCAPVTKTVGSNTAPALPHRQYADARRGLGCG